ncbi:MAG: outer membrane protein assembly factor BamB [Azonexaceae bacterium]|nr:outer membrane protein assembly factor BamB [Azonexaceae bacterium]
MRSRLITLAVLSVLAAGGCSTMSNALDAINPFGSSGPKMSPLPPLTAGTEFTTRWSVSVPKAGNDMVFVPATVGDAVYAAAGKGVLEKFEGGKRVWKIDVGQPLSAGVGANDRLVVVGTPKGEVLAFSAEDGKPRWQARVNSEVLAPPTVGDEGVAVRSGDNSIFLFGLEDGARKWVYQRSTPALSVRTTSAPVFADRFVFAGFPGGKIVAMSLQNGAPVWEGAVALPKGATELDRVADVVAPPVMEGSQLCAVAFQGRVACFDMAQGGSLIWSRDISSSVGLALDGRYLFVTDDQGVVYGLDRLSGSSLWKQDKLKNRRVSAPAVRLGYVAVGDAEGYVHFLSRDEGAFVGRQKTDGEAIKAPVKVFDSAFLVQTSGGELRLIEPK